MSSSVIVLTTSCQFWEERSLHDVLRLYFRGKINVVKADETKLIRGGVQKDGSIFHMPSPLVVCLTEFFGYKYKDEKVGYSDEAVYARDKNICQYWHYDENGKKFKYRITVDEKTIDHVIPRAQGGVRSFENCVASCRNCNEVLKKNHTPEEAGMELIRQPFVPSHRKGDNVIKQFSFNPNSKTHRAYYEYMGSEFTHVVK